MRNNDRVSQRGCVFNGSVVIANRQKKKPRRQRLYNLPVPPGGRRRGTSSLTVMTSASRLDTKGVERVGNHDTPVVG